MNFKYWKLMFFISLMLSVLITISSYSWLTMWIGLEINMLCIIPLMNNTKNMYSTESSLKYFIVQAMASSLFMFSIIMSSINDSMMISIIMNSALLTKVGSAPFHFWFPEIMEGQKWMMCLILLTIQKISPLILLNYNMNYPMFMFIIIISNMMISALLGLNQVSMRKILTFSSINHIGWMLASFLQFKTIWLTYFLTYTFILINLVFILNFFKIYFMKQLININMSKEFNLVFILNFFSLAGLPPFIGFLPKWLTIQSMMTLFPVLTLIMVVMTLFTMFYYLRVMMTSLMLTMNKSTNSTLNVKIKFLNFLSIFLLPLTCLIFIV
uniref:NADH dehydrogenase subunit 2 n=1 Tax=Oxytelus varipennis TaxID=1336280 RepID=UPI002A83DBAD|nr:NADH dehydrogenase subunit 2 [Oxytelus varipennis]WON66030.1 NADH dehydrogenase subunit 2 [Oxytelus varipennis]